MFSQVLAKCSSASVFIARSEPAVSFRTLIVANQSKLPEMFHCMIVCFKKLMFPILCKLHKKIFCCFNSLIRRINFLAKISSHEIQLKTRQYSWLSDHIKTCYFNFNQPFSASQVELIHLLDTNVCCLNMAGTFCYCKIEIFCCLGLSSVCLFLSAFSPFTDFVDSAFFWYFNFVTFFLNYKIFKEI